MLSHDPTGRWDGPTPVVWFHGSLRYNRMPTPPRGWSAGLLWHSATWFPMRASVLSGWGNLAT